MKKAAGPSTGGRAREGERLQKLLARTGIASRRGAEELIRAGRVTVNGEVAHLGQRATETDAVKLDGRRIGDAIQKRYLLINKPKATVTTVDDPEGRKTVLDLVPAGLRRGLFPVGRLDYHTEGLLIVTNDGDFSHRVGHPRFGCVKTYQVKVRGVPTAETIRRLEKGIVIEGRKTAACRIGPLELGPRTRTETTNSWWEVELVEGRTRQIREMFQRVGHPVQKLRRTAIGGLRDPHLPIGEIRELRPTEIRQLAAGGRAKGRKKMAPKRTRPTRPGKRPAPAGRRPTSGRSSRPTSGRSKGTTRR